jgi:hypothetical protein
MKTDELLEMCVRTIRRYVILTPEQLTAVALWVLHTHTVDAVDVTPFLVVTAPTMRSGKTRLLEVLELLVARPWRVALPSDAVLYRKIQRDRPTLLLDEVDAVFRSATERTEPLRALLNAGNRRGTRVPRVVQRRPGEFDLVEFDVFAPRALAAIGDLPATVMDRAVVIRMRRRAPNEPVERFVFGDAERELAPIREALQAWGTQTVGTLRGARPEIPAALDDRAAEAWWPLLAIADLGGDEWPARAREAALALSGATAREEDDLGVRLLADIRSIFDEGGVDRLPTADLVEALNEIDTAPWGDFRGRGLTAHALAKLLRRFGIAPTQWREGSSGGIRGYTREAFRDSWTRYLPTRTPQPHHLLHHASDAQIVTRGQPLQEGGVAITRNGESPLQTQDGAFVAVTPQVPDDPDEVRLYTFRLARERDFPRVEVRPGEFVGPGQAAWSRFVARAPLEQLLAAARALESI